jgi:hypothetical protein
MKSRNFIRYEASCAPAARSSSRPGSELGGARSRGNCLLLPLSCQRPLGRRITEPWRSRLTRAMFNTRPDAPAVVNPRPHACCLSCSKLQSWPSANEPSMNSRSWTPFDVSPEGSHSGDSCWTRVARRSSSLRSAFRHRSRASRTRNCWLTSLRCSIVAVRRSSVLSL